MTEVMEEEDPVEEAVMVVVDEATTAIAKVEDIVEDGMVAATVVEDPVDMEEAAVEAEMDADATTVEKTDILLVIAPLPPRAGLATNAIRPAISAGTVPPSLKLFHTNTFLTLTPHIVCTDGR